MAQSLMFRSSRAHILDSEFLKKSLLRNKISFLSNPHHNLSYGAMALQESSHIVKLVLTKGPNGKPKNIINFLLRENLSINQINLGLMIPPYASA